MSGTHLVAGDYRWGKNPLRSFPSEHSPATSHWGHLSSATCHWGKARQFRGKGRCLCQVVSMDARFTRMQESIEALTRLMAERGTMDRPAKRNVGNGQQSPYTRLDKLEFPKFSRDDVKGWVFRGEQFFILDQVIKAEKDYKQAVLARFGTVTDDHMSELKNLKYETTARAYEDTFDDLLSRIEISEDHAISLFIGGLPVEISMAVRMFKPRKLADAYCLTKLKEATINAVKKKGIMLYNGSTSGNARYPPGHKCSGQMYALEVLDGTECEEECLGEEELEELGEFEEVFSLLIVLPPNKSCDHKIPLLEGSQPVNVRPYRHPPTQKDSIEGMVQEILDTGVIRPSNSPFASPIVMVKKKDNTLEYLGHVISAEGVSTYPTKIKAMEEWPVPCNVKQLRGFLVAFESLKKAMISAPVLALPDFDKEFTVETDALSIRIVLSCDISFGKMEGVLVRQAFLNQDISLQSQIPLGTKNNTPTQMKWLPKLMGFDYEIIFKKEVENVSADALIADTWEEDNELKAKVDKLKKGEYVTNAYVWENHQLRRKGKLVVGNNAALRMELLTHFHSGPVGRHVGIKATMHKLCSLFYWRKMRREIKQFVRNCDVCQRSKPDVSAYPGLLQPLPIPNTVVQLSKYGHFIPLAHPFTAVEVAQAFLDNIYKLHGLPIRGLECYLRCMCGETPKDWGKWLSLAEWWYNTNYHSILKTTPCEVLYAQTPPIHIPYVSGESRVDTVDRTLTAREEVIKALTFHLKRSQERMKTQADKHRSEREFAVGDWVYLKLQPHRQVSMRMGKFSKLSPKYYGPFQLKRCKGQNLQVGILPQCDNSGLIQAQPVAILERKLGKVGNAAGVFVLVQWANSGPEDATWESIEDIQRRFPEFNVLV
ncbi:ty3-gypsy retrotransposon protein [Tanacetum coccineum]